MANVSTACIEGICKFMLNSRVTDSSMSNREFTVIWNNFGIAWFDCHGISKSTENVACCCMQENLYIYMYFTYNVIPITCMYCRAFISLSFSFLPKCVLYALFNAANFKAQVIFFPTFNNKFNLLLLVNRLFRLRIRRPHCFPCSDNSSRLLFTSSTSRGSRN